MQRKIVFRFCLYYLQLSYRPFRAARLTAKDNAAFVRRLSASWSRPSTSRSRSVSFDQAADQEAFAVRKPTEQEAKGDFRYTQIAWCE